MDSVWVQMYETAKAVQNERKISEPVDAGGVAAAILSESGNIYTGVCVDTACTLGVCAERNAIFSMITAGEHRISKVLALMEDGTGGGSLRCLPGADGTAHAGGVSKHRNYDGLSNWRNYHPWGTDAPVVD